MDRVATEVAQEVSALLQNQDLDSGPCQQVPQHHPGGPPPTMQHPTEDGKTDSILVFLRAKENISSSASE